MTNQELNEAVAEKLGLKTYKSNCLELVCVEGFEPFEPATDPAAALWALEKICSSLELSATLCIPWDESCDKLWGCKIQSNHYGTGTFCEAICRAIVAL